MPSFTNAIVKVFNKIKNVVIFWKTKEVDDSDLWSEVEDDISDVDISESTDDSKFIIVSENGHIDRQLVTEDEESVGSEEAHYRALADEFHEDKKADITMNGYHYGYAKKSNRKGDPVKKGKQQPGNPAKRAAGLKGKYPPPVDADLDQDLLV